MKIKICGLQNVENANQISALSPDFIGCIFTNKSLRKISIHKAKLIKHTEKVGVFVNQEIEEICKITKDCELKFIQLHGDESALYCKELKIKLPNIPIIKAFSIASEKDLFQLKNYKNEVDFYLFDTKGDNYGGNGKVFNWQILDKIENTKPFFLSGGIDLENIIEIIKLKHKPYAIDVNSKLEDRIGFKNITKTKEIISHVKSI